MTIFLGVQTLTVVDLGSRKSTISPGCSSTKAWSWARSHATAHARSDARTWACSDCMVGAQHAYTGAKLGAAKRDHVLSYVSGNYLPVLRRGVVENPLNQIVAVLVAGNVNEGDPGAVSTTLTNSIEVTSKEISTTNLKTLLHNLRGKLVSAVFGSITNDMVNSTAAVRRGAVLADMLDAPVSELSMCHNIDIGKDFFNARALWKMLDLVISLSKLTHLVFLETVLEDVLDNQASSLT